MTLYWVELSGENDSLARAEAKAAAETLGGKSAALDLRPIPRRIASIELDGTETARQLANRLGLAHRILCPWPESDPEEIDRRMEELGRTGVSARFRGAGPSDGNSAPSWHRFPQAFRLGGGLIDLTGGKLRLVTYQLADGSLRVAEEVAEVDRKALEARRQPTLPFRRPVNLPPRLARVLVNLARVRSGDQVIDPFLGTGALLAEAALLGARVSGIDQDPEMVRGTLRNFAHLGLEVDRIVVGDGGEVFRPPDGGHWDAIVTDPPYGRASSSAGEPPAELLTRILNRWALEVRPGGRVALAVPDASVTLLPCWRLVSAVPYPRHRSLTREFRVYERPATQ